MKTLRVIVCGTNYGQPYLTALQAAGERFQLAGILARGSRRSQCFAQELGVPLFLRVEELPGDIDMACVAVGASKLGGEGSVLALRLIERGLHVLQEHPVHPVDLVKLLRAAKARGVRYHVNSHFGDVEPVRAFIDYVTEARRHGRPLYVDATASLQCAYSLVDVLGRALGSLTPHGFTQSLQWDAKLSSLAEGGLAPFRCLQGILGGVPITLQFQSFYDPADAGNHQLVMHRICAGLPGGNLTLLNTYGPLTWTRTIHVPGYEAAQVDAVQPLRERQERLRGDTAPLTVELIGSPPATLSDVAGSYLPGAIHAALDRLAEELRTGTVAPEQSEAHLLAVSQVWFELMVRLGMPLQVSRPPPPPPRPDPLTFRSRPPPGV